MRARAADGSSGARRLGACTQRNARGRPSGASASEREVDQGTSGGPPCGQAAPARGQRDAREDRDQAEGTEPEVIRGDRPRAIGYLRVSSAGQAQDGRDGFPRQRDAIARYCSATRAELLEEHADAGVSGTVPLEGREGLSRALERCVELGAGVLVIEKADRLGRDLIVAELAVRAFAAVGVAIVTADGQDLTAADGDPTRTLIRQLLHALAQFEKSGLVARLRAARDRKRRRGEHPCGNYAFGKHPDRPEEAATLARIRELRRRSAHRRVRSLREVAEVLNAEGLASRSGKAWTATMVRDVARAQRRA